MMEDLYLGINIPATLIFKTYNKVLMEMVGVEICLRPVTLTPINQVTVIYCWVYLLLLALLIKVFMLMNEVIVVVMMEVVDLFLKRSANLLLNFLDKVLMVMVDVDIGIIPSPIHIMIQVELVYHWFSIFMVMIELDIGLIPTTLPPITILDYIFSTQGYLKMLFIGV